MPRSRALKEETMPVIQEETLQSMMKDAKDMMMDAKNSMMRGQAMMVGSQMMMKKKQMKKQMKDDDAELSDLGGMNFNPKKMKKEKK